MRLFWLGIVAAAGLGLGPGAGAGTLDAATIQEHTLPNGLQVLLRESHASNLVTVQFWVRAGSFLETAETAGTAHFIEHLWFKGTERRPAGNIDQEIEDLGSILKAETEKDWTVVQTTVASQYLGKALDVIADTVQHPRFRPADIEAERSIIMDEIASARADPARALVNRLYAATYRTHPYRFEVTGSPETVAAITPARIRNFFRRNYTLSNSVLVVIGDMQPAEVLRQVKALFPAPGPPAPRPVLPPAETQAPSTEPRRQVVETDLRAGYYGVAFPAPGIAAREDVYAMDVLVTLLEQNPWGRLPAALRDEAVAVRAGYQTLRQPGLLTVTVQCSPEKLDSVERLVLEEIAKLRAAPPSPGDLEGTKRILTGMYVVDNETVTGQGRTLGYYAAIDRWQFASTYLENIRKVTAEQVQQAAARYLTPERAVTVIMRPRSGDKASGG